MAILLKLNLDPSKPLGADPFYTSSLGTAGVIRFTDSDDAMLLPMFQRFQSDYINRSIIIEEKINQIIDVLTQNISGLESDTPDIYIKVDGSNAFAGPVSGVTPLENEHLTTKEYVDLADSNLESAINLVADQADAIEASQAKVFESDWVEFIWDAGNPKRVDFTLTPIDNVSIPNLDNIIGIQILERLNIAEASIAEPNPTPIYIYKSITPSRSDNGFAVDDTWFEIFEMEFLAHLLIPSESNFPVYPTSSGYKETQTPEDRYLKVVVTTHD